MNKKLMGLALVSSLFLSSGCSTMSSGLDAVGSGMVSAAEGLQKATTKVAVHKISEELFELETQFHEPVTTLDSWAMRIEARELCPDGYVYENRQALQASSFANSAADCVASGSCGYKLQWRIKCQAVPDEPFSFFGKS